VTVTVVSVAAVGATRAYFTSTVTSEGNTFSTGTIVLTDETETGAWNTVFNNIKPGDRVRKWVTIKNGGSLDIDYLTLKAVNVDDTNSLGQHLFDNVTISATGRVGSNDPAYFTDDWHNPPIVSAWMNGADMLDNSYYRAPAGVIHPGESYTMSFDFIFPTTLGNEWQNITATLDLEFTGEQVH